MKRVEGQVPHNRHFLGLCGGEVFGIGSNEQKTTKERTRGIKK
jgi:hypothetical protein